MTGITKSNGPPKVWQVGTAGAHVLCESSDCYCCMLSPEWLHHSSSSSPLTRQNYTSPAPILFRPTVQAITVAEDVSGMPGLGRKVAEGGVGFDYRLGMGLPNLWHSLTNPVSPGVCIPLI